MGCDIIAWVSCFNTPACNQPMHLLLQCMLLPAAKAGVNVSYSRGMDIIGEIHYDWPLESTLEVGRL